MRFLALLHRWAGGIVGLLLAVIGLSGTVLLWEGAWIGLRGADDPVAGDPAALGASVEAALALDPALSRITFASDEIGLHQAIYADGGGAYLDQAGAVVDRWDSLWGRPELWLFDLHHYLFLGEAGLWVTGTLGWLLLAFAVTGVVLWWRTRKTFRLRLLPARLTRSAIVRHHRDLGAVASPLLILSALTGAFMVFPAVPDALLAPWAAEAQPRPVPQAGGETSGEVPLPLAGGTRGGPGAIDWRAVMRNAQAAFPHAAPRRLMLPAATGEPLVLRLRQAFEWTPNGRTYVYLDPATAEVLATDDPATGDTASAITEKFYPVHAGKVGGVIWQLALTLSGLALVLLGSFATWSFWLAAPARPQPLPPRTPALAEPAE